MAMAPAMTLKRMYHCVPRSIRSMAAISRPPRRRSKKRRIIGKRAVAGMEAAICTSGCAMRAKRGFEPMATPTGMVQSAPRMSAVLTRRKVSVALSRSSS